MDKYLKVPVKETSWEPLSMRMGTALRARCLKAGDNVYVELKVTMGSVFHINEGDRAFLLLDNDESLPIECIRGGVANYDSAPSSTFWYGSYLYKLTEADMKKLLEHAIAGVRVGMGDEYTTFDKVKEKNATKFKNALALVTK